MFKKNLKIKSHTPVRASERKKFTELLQNIFPALTDADINEFLPKKTPLFYLKTTTHSGQIVPVYIVDNRPVLFAIEDKYFPTLYLQWKFPNLLPVFTIHPDVMSHITQGADLMLPGVLVGKNRYGNVNEGDVVGVNLANNKACVAIGTALQSSYDMERANGRGKCVKVFHYYGDQLCLLESKEALSLPALGPPDWLAPLAEYAKSTGKYFPTGPSEADFPPLGKKANAPQRTERAPPQKEEENEEKLAPVETPDEAVNTIEPEPIAEPDSDSESSVESMDKLLEHCFMIAIKYSKDLKLPILVSNFFKLKMVPACPPSKTLDVKKSSYKKLSKFLAKMSEKGLITIKEEKKGVEMIASINRDHPQFGEFYLSPEDRPRDRESTANESPSTSIRELYMVTRNVSPIFEKEGLKKNDTVDGSEVRRIVTKYVKENNCQHADNPKLVIPNETIQQICRTEAPVTWEELMEKVLISMKNCYKVSSASANEDIFNKGKVSPITMNVGTRSGNKKVTLVDNLELFGINIGEFAKECQHGVAASTSISKPPSKKYDQLLIQGNQILFVYNLLTEKYKIPKKYIKGLENAPKKKK